MFPKLYDIDKFQKGKFEKLILDKMESVPAPHGQR